VSACEVVSVRLRCLLQSKVVASGSAACCNQRLCPSGSGACCNQRLWRPAQLPAAIKGCVRPAQVPAAITGCGIRLGACRNRGEGAA